jgi:hypothetical protein
MRMILWVYLEAGESSNQISLIEFSEFLMKSFQRRLGGAI